MLLTGRSEKGSDILRQKKTDLLHRRRLCRRPHHGHDCVEVPAHRGACAGAPRRRPGLTPAAPFPHRSSWWTSRSRASTPGTATSCPSTSPAWMRSCWLRGAWACGGVTGARGARDHGRAGWAACTSASHSPTFPPERWVGGAGRAAAARAGPRAGGNKNAGASRAAAPPFSHHAPPSQRAQPVLLHRREEAHRGGGRHLREVRWRPRPGGRRRAIRTSAPAAPASPAAPRLAA